MNIYEYKLVATKYNGDTIESLVYSAESDEVIVRRRIRAAFEISLDLQGYSLSSFVLVRAVNILSGEFKLEMDNTFLPHVDGEAILNGAIIEMVENIILNA